MSDEYKSDFDRAARDWMAAAGARMDKLEPVDRAGAMFCAGINYLLLHGADRGDVAEWVRSLADALESGEPNGPSVN